LHERNWIPKIFDTSGALNDVKIPLTYIYSSVFYNQHLMPYALSSTSSIIKKIRDTLVLPPDPSLHDRFAYTLFDPF